MPDAKLVPEVVITGTHDRKTLEQVIIPKFVASHSAPAAATGQLARWRLPICPRVTGVEAVYAGYLTQRIIQQAQSVGAPTASTAPPCVPNIEILFTPYPQQQLDGIAHQYPRLLGSGRQRGDTTMSRAIQAWYLTGTRTDPQRGVSCGSGLAAVPDPAWGNETSVCGQAGSRLTHHMHSELLHVLVIVDAGKLTQTHLEATADYIAMIALSRVGSMDACSELPSILDLLAAACAERPRPEAITAADGVFLKSLYRADLGDNLNFEEADIRSQMLSELSGPR